MLPFYVEFGRTSLSRQYSWGQTRSPSLCQELQSFDAGDEAFDNTDWFDFTDGHHGKRRKKVWYFHHVLVVKCIMEGFVMIVHAIHDISSVLCIEACIMTESFIFRCWFYICVVPYVTIAHTEMYTSPGFSSLADQSMDPTLNRESHDSCIVNNHRQNLVQKIWPDPTLIAL